MAILFDAPVQPDAVTEFVRLVPTPANFALTALFGEAKNENRNTVNFLEITRTNRTAKFRSYDGSIYTADRDDGFEKQIKLPPLSASLSMGEYERLQLEFARTAGTNQQALARSIYDDATILTNMVKARMELAIGDILEDGKLSIDEGGLISEADFGVPGGNKVTPGAADWDNTTGATLLTDMLAWSDAFNALNGFRPESALTSLRLLRLAQRNAEVIAAVYGSLLGKTRVTVDELNGLMASEGLPTFRPAYDTKVDVDGSFVRVLSDDKVILLPPQPETLVDVTYGVSATALELVNSSESDMSFEEAPGIVGVVEKDGPPYRQFTFVDAVGLPVLNSGRQLMIATAIS